MCRIARYETSPIVARMAALAVLNDMQHEEAIAEEGTAIVGKEIADCVRLPVQWISKHFKQHQQADSTKSGWLEEIDREITLQNEDSNKTNAESVFHLLKYYLGVCKNSAGVESAVEPLERMMAMRLGEGGELRRGLIFSLSWCTEHKQWQVIAELEKTVRGANKERSFLAVSGCGSSGASR